MPRVLLLAAFFGLVLGQGFKPSLERVVQAHLQDLVLRAEALEALAQGYAEDPTPARLEALRAAWRLAREPWEALEAFAFGPTGEYDPLLDTWPISPKDLEATLGQPPAVLPPEARGFHALEYLLFAQPPGDPKARAHLPALAQDLRANAQGLFAAWREYLQGAGEEELAEELWATARELAHELFDEKLASSESPYAQASWEDYRANLLGLGEALGLLGVGEGAVEAYRRAWAALQALPRPLEGALQGPEAERARAAFRALHQALLPHDRAAQALAWVRAFRMEYLEEGEVDEGLTALAGLEEALQGTPLLAQAAPLLEALRAKVRAAAPAAEVEALLRDLETLLRR